MFNFSVNKTLEQKPTKDSRRFMVASKACHERKFEQRLVHSLPWETSRTSTAIYKFDQCISIQLETNWISVFTYINACKCITTNLVIITVFLERRRFNNNGLVTITQDITTVNGGQLSRLGRKHGIWWKTQIWWKTRRVWWKTRDLVENTAGLVENTGSGWWKKE